jgi:hypothetical protein
MQTASRKIPLVGLGAQPLGSAPLGMKRRTPRPSGNLIWRGLEWRPPDEGVRAPRDPRPARSSPPRTLPRLRESVPRTRLRRARADAGRVCGVFVLEHRPSHARRESCARQPRRRGRSRLRSKRRGFRRSGPLLHDRAWFDPRRQSPQAPRRYRSRSKLRVARGRVDAAQMPRDRLVRGEVAWVREEIAGKGPLG